MSEMIVDRMALSDNGPQYVDISQTFYRQPFDEELEELFGMTRDEATWLQRGNNIDVMLRGGRLQITADVDLEGIDGLKEILGHYEAILKCLEEPVEKVSE